jgi:hypothetical protein
MRGGKSSESNTVGAQGVNQNYKKDTNYDPYPGGVFIHDNQFSNSYLLPDLGNDFGKLLLSKFWLTQPIIAWDGILAPGQKSKEDALNSDYRICVDESEDIKVVNLDAGNDFENISTDSEKFKCEAR